MTSQEGLDRRMAATISVLLDQGVLADRLSRGLTIACLAGLVALGILSVIPAMLLIGAAALAGLVELWFAIRVAFDAALFYQLSLAEDGPDWATLDSALTELHLLPAEQAGRPIEQRIAGAMRLLRRQIIALIVQIALIAAAAASGLAQ
jgi:hypothetical protein